MGKLYSSVSWSINEFRTKCAVKQWIWLKKVHWRCNLEGYIFIPATSLLSHSLFSDYHEVSSSSLPHISIMLSLCWNQPPLTNPLKPWTKMNLFSFKLQMSGILSQWQIKKLHTVCKDRQAQFWHHTIHETLLVRSCVRILSRTLTIKSSFVMLKYMQYELKWGQLSVSEREDCVEETIKRFIQDLKVMAGRVKYYGSKRLEARSNMTCLDF